MFPLAFFFLNPNLCASKLLMIQRCEGKIVTFHHFNPTVKILKFSCFLKEHIHQKMGENILMSSN